MVDRQKKETVVNAEAFYNDYKKKLKVPFGQGLNRVIAALEMVLDQGVIAICNGREERVKISGYKCYGRMNEHQVFAIIDSGIPLMATFPVKKDFWDLKDEVYELTPHKDGDAAPETHIVMFVGYGMKDGRPYLVFLNSYGTDWGTRGLGRVYFDQVFQLDFKGFQSIRVKVDGHNNAPTPHRER